MIVTKGPRVQVTATKEVILSAGVIGTPQILKLSGIGAKDELSRVGIPSVIDLPDVGTNLADHPMLANYFQVKSNGTWDDVLRDNNIFGQNIGLWESSKQGLFTDSPGNTVGFFRLPAGSPALKGTQDPAAGPKSGHTELIFVVRPALFHILYVPHSSRKQDGFAQFGSTAQPAQGNFITVLSAVVSPTSRKYCHHCDPAIQMSSPYAMLFSGGTVKLASANPFDQPLIDPNFLTTAFDTAAIVQSVNDALTFMSAAPWQKVFKPVPWGDLAKAKTDAQKLAFARNNAVNVNHPVGTARMASSAKGGVVDSQLRLKGGDGLRVVDASIFVRAHFDPLRSSAVFADHSFIQPVIPECHPQALVYIVAERAADLIKHTYGLS